MKVHVTKITIILFLVVFIGSAFPGGQRATPAVERLQMNPVGTYPFVNQPVNMSVLAPTQPKTDNYRDNWFTRWYEERTNVRVDWITVPMADYIQRLNVLIASGDYPEVLLNTLWNLTDQQFYASEGIILPLNQYIDQWGNEFPRVLREYPILEDLLTLPDGNIYSLTGVTGAFHFATRHKMWVYRPWLERLGLSMPETTADFERMLIAFRDRDPNGNGRADEIPLAGAPGGFTRIDLFLMNAFIYNDGERRLIVRNGRVLPAFAQPEWREGLRYIHRLVQQGLIAPESFTQSPQQLVQLGEHSGVPILGAAAALFQGQITNVGGESGRWQEYISVPPLRGPNGVRQSFYDPWVLSDGRSSFNITNRARHPELAYRWGDAMYDIETSMNMNFGRPGVEWTWIQPNSGLLGMDGRPATWDLLIGIAQQENNIHWNQTGPQFRPYDESHSRRVSRPDSFEPILFQESLNNYMPFIPNIDTLLPPLAVAQSDLEELARIESVLRQYVEESIARFAVGNLNIDTDWDRYLQELRAIGLDRYVAIYQRALDAIR